MTIPVSVRVAAVLWFAAVGAGLLESALAVARAGSFDSGLWTQIGVRVVLYTLAALLVDQFRRGRRWSRLALTVLLTVVGLGSLVVPMALAALRGEPATSGGALFTAVRAMHISCVVAASVLMFSPSANRYFGERVTTGSAGT